MQILEIVLYSHDGRRRVLPLKPGRTNIIPGRSGTGKSSLIDIVDFCLGRTECTVPDGVVRDKVAWYGLRLQFPAGQMFVARQAPPPHRQYNNRVYLEQGDEVSSPERAPAEPNTNAEALEDALTNKLGIAPNLNSPAPGQTYAPLAANMRHALIYCFQHQTEIATRNYLFHRQFEDFVPQAIRLTLPYFLGAIQEDRLALEQELARARREVRMAEQRLKEAEAIRGDGVTKATGLLSEARGVGLLPAGNNPERIEGIVALLRRVSGWTPEAATFAGSQRLTQLQEEARELERQYEEKSDAVRAARTFAQEAEGYMSEAHQQELRLESIGLFDTTDHNSEVCPVCSHGMDVPVPAADAIRRSLQQLKANLDSTTRERPRLRDYIEGLERDREELRQKIREKGEAINGALQEEAAARQLQDLNARRARVLGRVSLWLESVSFTDDTSSLREDVVRKQGRVTALEQQLGEGEKDERLNSILNRIGVQMTEWASKLELEHSGSPVRLDLSRVTVVVDREDRPIPLSNLGSGKNWLGSHLIAHLALHKHFRQHNRPVPRFLFLDQPSQVFYPADRDAELQGSVAGISDEDQREVARMYNLIFDVVESLAPDFQVIITDHADLLADARFQASVVERWRGPHALVPQDWIDG
jgi:hypothetical protein